MRLLSLAMRHGGGCVSGGLTSALPLGIHHEVIKRQDIVPATSHSDRVPIQVYLDPGQWEKFAEVARAHDRSRSAQVRELIRRANEAHEEKVAA